MLADQFEDEIEARLVKFDERMIKQHPGLFDPATDPNVKAGPGGSSALKIHRINHTLEGALVPDDGQNRRLNVHLYWMPPAEYNRIDIDGALRSFGYKITVPDIRAS